MRKQHGARRRLFEQLEQRVGAFWREPIGVVDDADAAAAHQRPEGEVVAEAFLIPVVSVADELVDLEHFRVARRWTTCTSGCVPASHMMHDWQRPQGASVGGIGSFAEQRLGELQGEGPFADALGADEQIRRGEPAGREAAAELLDDVVVSVKALPHGGSYELEECRRGLGRESPVRGDVDPGGRGCAARRHPIAMASGGTRGRRVAG